MSTTASIHYEAEVGCRVQGELSVHQQAYSMSGVSLRVPGVELQHEGPLPREASERNVRKCMCLYDVCCVQQYTAVADD